MRNYIDLISEMSAAAVSKLKTDIKNQVDKTSDEELLDKIYTVLNQTNLVDRISGTLERETDTSGYVADLTKLIIDTPGTYKEKHDFVLGFPNGYINVKAMLSGQRVKFDELITGGPFVFRVFEALKGITFGTAKGPGEFALAVMSPHIKITGKGDLNIKDKVVEVKANLGKAGGRLGTPGSLNAENVAAIISKHTQVPEAKLKSNNLGLGGLVILCQNLSSTQRSALGKELFDYIFGGEVDTSGLVSALAAGDEARLKKEYTKTNYMHYQHETNYTGLMLMNFQSQELKYYTDPASMADEIYEPGVYLISKDKAFTARQILSQVTLRPFKEPKIALPTATPGQQDAELETQVNDFANQLAVKFKITDPAVIGQIATLTATALQNGVKSNKIMALLQSEIPALQPKSQPAAPQPAPVQPESRILPTQTMIRERRWR
jgi:hypothetical protein